MESVNENTKDTTVIEGDQSMGEEAPAETVAQDAKNISLTKDEFNKVKAHIEALQGEKDEAVNLLKRVQADFDNYRRRNSTLKKDSYDEGVRDCLRAILPTLDNLDRALANTEGVGEAYVDGVRLILRNLLAALEKFGMKEIETDGGFDANLHHAVLQEAIEGKEQGEILEVLQKGYEAEGKILRHSMVKVAQ